MKLRNHLAAALMAAGFACPVGALAQSPLVATQSPCPNDFCLEFGSDAPTELTAQIIEKPSPVTGSAIVTFHGTLECKPGLIEASRLISIHSQIVGLSNTAVDGNDVGGHVFTALLWTDLPDTPSYAPYGANTFNLASSRTFRVTEGQTLRVAFRLKRISMSADVRCVVHKSSAFTIQFVP